MEIGELAGLKKAEVGAIKLFISKREDRFRPAYARTVETFRRQCVFFGTTNDPEFLRDPSGNRRFMPVDVRDEYVTKDVFSKEFADSIDQIWAEAVHRYKEGEHLYLSLEADLIADGSRHGHTDVDSRQGVIEHYLNMLLPPNWDTMDLFARRMFINDPDKNTTGRILRTSVCIAEIWCECLGKEKEDMSRYNTRDINDIMKGLRKWSCQSSTKYFPYYGKQKYYSLKNDLL